MKKQHKDNIEYLFEQTANVDFPGHLFSAVSAGLEIYKLYLSKNLDILGHEWQVLGDAGCLDLVHNKVEFLTYLLKTAGANPGISFHHSTRYFYTLLPLEFAAYSSSEANARLLLKYGAIINGTNAL
jgi:ankyrin repeat protein